MRVVFLLALLAASVFYTYVAFTDLAFLSRTGRLGPGFFPRLIGCGLIVVCLFCLPLDVRRMRTDDTDSPYWSTLLTLAGLAAAMVALFPLIGGILAMVAFLLASLSILNARRPIQNVAAAILLPLGVYLLFDVWLNASLPQGRLPLPI